MSQVGYCHQSWLSPFHDLSTAFYYYQKAYEGGSGVGTYNLAVDYQNGDGVYCDCQKAIKLFFEASEVYEYPSSFNVCFWFLSVEFGTKRDLREFVKFLEKSAKLKHAGSCIYKETRILWGQLVCFRNNLKFCEFKSWSKFMIEEIHFLISVYRMHDKEEGKNIQTNHSI